MLSKVTITKLRQVKRAILAEPKFYAQDESPYMAESCETPCCIAGWAVWIDNPDPKAYVTACQKNIGEHLLRDALAITDRQTNLLFYGWPRQFSDAWDYPGTVKAAKAAAARIEHFIATKGQE